MEEASDQLGETSASWRRRHLRGRRTARRLRERPSVPGPASSRRRAAIASDAVPTCRGRRRRPARCVRWARSRSPPGSEALGPPWRSGRGRRSPIAEATAHRRRGRRRPAPRSPWPRPDDGVHDRRRGLPATGFSVPSDRSLTVTGTGSAPTTEHGGGKGFEALEVGADHARTSSGRSDGSATNKWPSASRSTSSWRIVP